MFFHKGMQEQMRLFVMLEVGGTCQLYCISGYNNAYYSDQKINVNVSPSDNLVSGPPPASIICSLVATPI